MRYIFKILQSMLNHYRFLCCSFTSVIMFFLSSKIIHKFNRIGLQNREKE